MTRIRTRSSKKTPASAPPISEALVALAQTVLRQPTKPDPGVAYMALLLAHAAWNKAVVGVVPPEVLLAYRSTWGSDPELWSHFTAGSVDALLESLVEAKQRLFPHDYRFVTSCTMTKDGRVRAQWGQVGSA